MKKLQSLLCLMAVVTVQMAWGQRLNLSKYNNASGLPQNYVYSIVQDNNGYIWIATAEGLARYDGVNFRNYFSRDSLADDFVYKLLIDKEKGPRLYLFLQLLRRRAVQQTDCRRGIVAHPRHVHR